MRLSVLRRANALDDARRRPPEKGACRSPSDSVVATVLDQMPALERTILVMDAIRPLAATTCTFGARVRSWMISWRVRSPLLTVLETFTSDAAGSFQKNFSDGSRSREETAAVAFCAYHLSAARPAIAPANARPVMAIVYHVATNRGESSVQSVA